MTDKTRPGLTASLLHTSSGHPAGQAGSQWAKILSLTDGPLHLPGHLGAPKLVILRQAGRRKISPPAGQWAIHPGRREAVSSQKAHSGGLGQAALHPGKDRQEKEQGQEDNLHI